ncbi:MAG: DUF938 domain-containing protein [Sphingomonadales bacterium]
MTGGRNTYHPPGADGRMHAPATARNRDFILEVLRRVLPHQGTILEVASGTGEHAVHMAPALPDHHWLPSDLDEGRLQSIRAWTAARPAPNLLGPVVLDVTATRWPVEDSAPDQGISAILAINLIHIAPWAACLGLLAGAGRILPAGGILYLYGPFRRGGQHTAPSNDAFDRKLRGDNPDWGVRDLDDVERAANDHGLELADVTEMPANNLSVVFRKTP